MDVAYIIIRHPASHDSTSATAQRNIAAFAFNPGRCFQREQGESSLATDVIIAALGQTLEKRASPRRRLTIGRDYKHVMFVSRYIAKRRVLLRQHGHV